MPRSPWTPTLQVRLRRLHRLRAGCCVDTTLALPAHPQLFLTLEGNIQEETKPPIFLHNFGKAPVSDLYLSTSCHRTSLALNTLALVMRLVSTATLGGHHVDHRTPMHNQQTLPLTRTSSNPKLLKVLPTELAVIAYNVIPKGDV